MHTIHKSVLHSLPGLLDWLIPTQLLDTTQKQITVPPEFRTKERLELSRLWWNNSFSFKQKEYIESFYSNTHFGPTSLMVIRKDLLQVVAMLAHDWRESPDWPEWEIKGGQFLP